MNQLQQRTGVENNSFINSEPFMEEGFRTVIEDHLDILKQHPSTSRIEVSPSEAVRFEYHFYNLLRFKNVPYHLHWIVLRMNDRIDPFASCKDIRQILVPSNQEIEVLLSYYSTMRKR